MDKPAILEAFENGEYYDYLDQLYETIDHEKHEEEILGDNKNVY